jgi:hypothetical protein
LQRRKINFTCDGSLTADKEGEMSTLFGAYDLPHVDFLVVMERRKREIRRLLRKKERLTRDGQALEALRVGRRADHLLMLNESGRGRATRPAFRFWERFDSDSGC